MQEYEGLVFERSIVKLDILQLERDVLDAVQDNAESWYGRQDRVEVIAPASPQVVVEDIVLEEDVPLPESPLG